MTDWFRSWHGAPTDPKWLGVARRAGVAPGIAVAIAWALMDRASQASERGNIGGYDADALACFFGCDEHQVEAVVAAMTDKGMLDDGRFVAWERRQPKREDDSTERVRQHRKRLETQRNASVTHGNAPDTDTDTEKKDLDSAFAEFTANYPRRKGTDPTKPARQKYEAAVKRGAMPEDINKGAAHYAAEQSKLGHVDTEFVKQRVVWLNQECWKDYQQLNGTGPPNDVRWLPADSPDWPAMDDRSVRETGKHLRPLPSKAQMGKGAYVPLAWTGTGTGERA